MAFPDSGGELEAGRDGQRFTELLRDLQTAGLGAQIVFGFLLVVPFTAMFTRFSATQRGLYLAALLLAAASIAMLLGPVTYHRVRFRRHRQERIMPVIIAISVLGLGALSLAGLSAVLLVASYAQGPAGI